MKTVVAIALALGACRSPARPSGPPPPLSRAAYAHYLDGKMAMYAKDWATATVALEAARTAAPEEPMIVVELARAYAKAKQVAQARTTLASARQRWPEHAEIWIASADLADGPEAAPLYRRAIELAPDDERGYLGRARVEPATAEATLRTLVKRVPDSVDGHYRLAVTLAKRDDLAGAIPELRAVLERDPDHIDARLDLARALRRTGHLDEAIVQTRGAFDRAAQPLDVAEELFWVLVEADDRTGALDLLTLLDDDRSDIDALATIARLDRGLGRIAEAKAIAEKIARQDADAGAITLAEAELAGGDPNAALTRLAAIPETSEHLVLARRTMAELLLANGEAARVPEVLAAARQKDPKSIELALLVAYAAVDRGALPEALRALAPFGDTPEARFARARLLQRAGDHAAVIAELEPVVRADPDAVGPQNLLGYVLVEVNRLPEARTHLLRARALAPGDPAILDSWGFLLLHEGAVDDAIKVLGKAHRYAPREPEILAHLAEAWLARGAPRSAADLLDEAGRLPLTPPARREIERVRRAIAARK